MKGILSVYPALFASLTTLFCCALPALLVLLGFGLTSVLAFFAAIPGWQEFGAYDLWLFPVSGALLALGFYLAYFRRSIPGEACAIWREAENRLRRLRSLQSLDSLVLALPFRDRSGDGFLGNRLDEGPGLPDY